MFANFLISNRIKQGTQLTMNPSDNDYWVVPFRAVSYRFVLLLGSTSTTINASSSTSVFPHFLISDQGRTLSKRSQGWYLWICTLAFRRCYFSLGETTTSPIPPPISRICSDFLGRLQPSNTTLRKTLNTLGVEKSSYPRRVLHF